MSKKLVGGEFLLDLTPITIEESVDVETYTNITNASVIEQLTNLKTYISNPKAIKPIWVKFVNDENNAVIVTRGSLSIVDTGEFDIDVAIKGYTLKIHIEFTQAELEDHTLIDDWYIDTNDAKYLFTSDAQNISPIVEDVIESAVKPIYWHNVRLVRLGVPDVRNYVISLIILNNSSTPIDMTSLQALIRTEGFLAQAINSRLTGSADGTGGLTQQIAFISYLDDANFSAICYGTDNSYPVNITLGFGNATITDTVNKIN